MPTEFSHSRTSTDTNVAPLILHSDQDSDDMVRAETPFATVRLLSFRSQEARSQQLPNQDYARLIADPEKRSLSFCVCDGVGSSYMGGFAAAYLGKRLSTWLQTLGAASSKTKSVYTLLSTTLAEWCRSGQDELCRRHIPSTEGRLVEEVLTELRTHHGSETVFFAGHIESLVRPDAGLRSSWYGPVKVLLCWMGNVRAEVFRDQVDSVDIGYRADDHVRWSTARGLCGTPRMFTTTLDRLHRLIVQTDGAESISIRIADASDQELARSAHHLQSVPTGDDITVLDVVWLPAS